MSTCLFGNTFGHMFYLKESKKGRCRNFNEKTRKHEKRTGKFELLSPEEVLIETAELIKNIDLKLQLYQQEIR